MFDLKKANALLPFGKAWRHDSDGVMFEADSKHSEKYVSYQELETLHPLLPQAMVLLKIKRPLCDSSAIKQVLRLWDAYAYVENIAGDKVGIAHASQVKILDSSVSIECQAIPYTEEALPDGQGVLAIPDSEESAGTLIRRKWLDVHYPGWKERFEVAVSLDLSLDDALAAMCTTPSNAHVAELPQDMQP